LERRGENSSSCVPGRNNISNASAITVGVNGTVYIAGTTGWIAGDAGEGTPCYWQNGVIKTLSLPNNASIGINNNFPIVAGANGTVYIAGSYTEYPNNNWLESINKICYWQDGVRKDIPVPTGSQFSNVKAIAVETDGTVYISSYYIDENDRRIVCYWQGNIRYDIGILENGEEIWNQFIVIK